MRKMHLMRADALVVFPGGFGTFDELFEILTLHQVNKAPPIPVVLVDETYWRAVISFDTLLEQGMIDSCRPRAVLLRRGRREHVALPAGTGAEAGREHRSSRPP